MTANVPYAEVIGDPISHSRSPVIHNFWIQKLGLEAEYRAHHVAPENLEGYFAARREDPNWRGCNITLPHKVASLDHVSDPGGVRDSIGAINTVFLIDGKLAGTNTDSGGFYLPISNMPLADAHAVIVGAGGAARAILFALKKAGIGKVTLLARNQLKAMGLLAIFGVKGEVLAMGAQLPEDAILLVNSSPLGMKGQDDLGIDLSPLREDALVYDIVYTPLETSLLKAAKAHNLAAVGGLDMLIGQAALAFELLFGKAPPEGHDDELRKLLTS